jgi:hypothetical protein
VRSAKVERTVKARDVRGAGIVWLRKGLAARTRRALLVWKPTMVGSRRRAFRGLWISEIE